MASTTEFTVIGEQKIHCEGCEQLVGRALRRLDGVQEVQASAQTQRVAVRFDPNLVRPEQVRARLEQMGYEAREELRHENA